MPPAQPASSMMQVMRVTCRGVLSFVIVTVAIWTTPRMRLVELQIVMMCSSADMTRVPV